ncbi:retrovirus-related pol polyprotein from transposon TNT 1-94 [Tanacetum coccineum]
MKCGTMDSVKPKVLALGMYAIDVELISPRNRNNREVHLDYLKHLKESVETLCEIVEEARVEKTLDSSLASAYLYTKRSQELLEYVIGTCPKDFNKIDKKIATTPLTRRKQKEIYFRSSVPLTRFTKSKVVPVKKHKNVSTSKTVIPERFSNTSHKPLTRYQHKNKQEKETSTGIPTIAETQTTDSSMKYTVVQIVLWYLDSGCSKHMTGNRSRLMNFMKKFIKSVRLGNDHFGAIMGQFCASDLEVAFKKHSYYVKTEDGMDLLKDNGTEFVNQVLTEYYENVSIFHQKSISRTPQQNGVVERRNRTLVEAARTMLIFSKALMFLWAEAVATACYTQNRSLIHTRHNKTPYELVHDKKPDLKFL